MNPTGTTRRSAGWMAGAAGAALMVLAACGSGGGSGGSFVVTSTIFGYDPFTGNFNASGQQGEPPLIPLNMCVVFNFSSPISPGSANATSIVVQELTSLNPPTPGPLAAATFTVTGSRLTICPLITFTDTNATFGWGSQSQKKIYQILFQVAPSTTVVRSSGGKAISASDRGPYLFQTSTQIFDKKPGAPVPTMRLLDPVSGAQLPTVDTPFDPVPLVEIKFDEPVIPSTAVDPGGVGTSSNIHIELDTDNDAATTADRILIPGFYTLTETDVDATVLWTSLLAELPTAQNPPDATNGCLYVITVDGTVQDLSGNDKVSETKNANARDVFTFRTLPGPSTSPVDPFVEPFDDQANSDLTVTSASWGNAFAGFLTPGIGGGTGADGLFDPTDAGFLANPPSGVSINNPARIITMNTESLVTPGTQRLFEFTTLRVPGNWTVIATGRFPLSIQMTGSATFSGIFNISGAAGAVYVAGAVTGGAGGASTLNGAAGGRGGATTDSAGVDTFFPGKGGAPVGYGKLAFGGSSAANQGASGRSTALDNANFTLTDSTFAANLGGLGIANLWIQPNLGADDFRFERYHTAFKVTGIAAGVVTVVSDPNDPLYRGELSQETTNPWLEDDGTGGFRAPLLTELFDSYVIGELRGLAGSALFDLDLDGNANDTVKASAGTGSEPQAVTQTFLTLGRSGGGGGGGASTAGSKGQDDPTVANGPGAFGGTGFVGAPGGAAGPSGILLQRVDSDTLRVTTPLFDDGTGNPDPGFEGHLINPNIGQGNTFRIESVDAVDTVTIARISTATGLLIDLSNTVMLPGNTVRVTPPYDAGGTGGGGAGVHCAGSSKTPAGHQGHPDLSDPRNQNGAANTAGFFDDDGGIAPPNQVQDGLEDTNPSGEAIFTLPRWVPGGGGGAGGGSARIVAAGNIDVTASGQLLSDGGEGGRSDLAGASAASGGGGGAGGTIFLGAGGTLSAAVGARISCAGGIGGAQGFGVEGGAGAPGRIRLENANGNLVAANFSGVGTPAITAEHLGIFPGGGDSVAQSIFVAVGALVPTYQRLVVNYTALKDNAPFTGVYIVLPDGTVDPASSLVVPPFDLRVSAAPSDPATGFVDATGATPFADPTITPMQNYNGLPFIRFRIVLGDASTPINLGGSDYTEIRIDDIEFNADSVKP